MAFSAADLQKRHELEGAPDPFPSLGPNTPAKPRAHASNHLDTESEAAFPSLSSATPPTMSRTSSSQSVWGAASGPRIKSTGQKVPVCVDSFTLSAIDLSHTGKDGKPTSLGDVMRQVMAKYKVKIEASANQRARQTTFHLKADSQKELDKAKRSLFALLSPVVTLVINAPASTIPSIIGPRGATLKQIRDQTGVRIDIPKREVTTPVTGIGHANGNAAHDDEYEEELTIPVTLVGPQPLAFEAQTMLKQIIASRAPKYKQRVRDIPVHILPFVSSRYATLASDQVNLSLNFESREITLTGDREAVGEVVGSVKHMISELESSITSIKMSLPQRQHRLLTGGYADDIMKKSNCSVFIGQGAEVIVWGHSPDLAAGLTAVMAQANSKYTHEFALPGPVELSKQLATYFGRIHLDRFIKSKHDVETFLPSPQSESESLCIELVGDKPEVDASVKVVAELIGKLIGGIREVSVDWLLHRVVIGKNAKRLKQIYEIQNVQVYFPNESLELSQILLVHDPMTSAATSPNEKQKRLDDVEKELLKLAREAANVKTEIVALEKRWHDAVLGSGRTTLNALIGEDTTLSIKVGAEATNQEGEDVIVVRGISSEVDRVVKEILKIAEDAKNYEIVNSFSTEFEIDKEYVGRIVGSQGVGVNKLRDQLGVRVDVFDELDEKEEKGGKKKKLAHQKCRIKITGRKENAEEAKKRIFAQVERLADETSEVLRIPAQYHSSLIGLGGKYAIRLEEKYCVKITFPRHSSEGDGKTREQLKADEVLVKGGKKGVAGAKSELIEALEYEKENNNVLKFTIPTRSVARVLGRGGASINEIKDQTDAQIDIDKGTEVNGVSTVITLRGTKKAIASAKSAIVAISDQVVDEITVSVTVESKYHRNIIGAGGQGLKDLIARCGGPSDSKLHAFIIRFPRHGEPSDEVRLRGESTLVAKLKAELERIVADLRDRVVLGVDVPVTQHRVLIGRGGQNLNDIQNKFKVQIQIPGSRSYEHFGEPENIGDLSDVDPTNIVKVSGARAACEKAIAQLQSNLKGPAAEITKDVTVPLKYHNAISQQGSFFRTLRNFGVFVDHSALPTKSGIPSRPPAARIDEAEAGEPEWEIVSNYQDTDIDEGDSTWTLKAKDQAGMERAEELIQEAINYASTFTHVGFLTLPDRSLFPKIVGTKGANVSRLRNETGADIIVSRENNTITITGTESHVNAAKEAILRMSNGRPRRSE